MWGECPPGSPQTLCSPYKAQSERWDSQSYHHQAPNTAWSSPSPTHSGRSVSPAAGAPQSAGGSELDGVIGRSSGPSSRGRQGAPGCESCLKAADSLGCISPLVLCPLSFASLGLYFLISRMGMIMPTSAEGFTSNRSTATCA